MTDRYRQISGIQPENESDIMLRLRTLAGEIFNERAYAEYILRQMFPTTAQGEYLDAHAAQRGLSRRAGTKAEGEVVLISESEIHGDILIPQGTVVCTADNMKRFVTKYDYPMTSTHNSVAIEVEAAENGYDYNIGANKIGFMVTPVIGVGSVRNDDPFIGGSDDESDAELRARVLDSYVNISNGTNAAYYRSIAMSVDGVYSASVVGCARGAGTVDVYACGKGVPITDAKLAQIQELLSEARELNVDVRACHPTPVQINLYIRLTVRDGYYFDDVAENVRAAVTKYINELGIGHDIMLSNIGEIIYHVDGVLDYQFLESYGGNRIIDGSKYTVANSILVRDY